MFVQLDNNDDDDDDVYITEKPNRCFIIKEL